MRESLRMQLNPYVCSEVHVLHMFLFAFLQCSCRAENSGGDVQIPSFACNQLRAAQYSMLSLLSISLLFAFAAIYCFICKV